MHYGPKCTVVPIIMADATPACTRFIQDFPLLSIMMVAGACLCLVQCGAEYFVVVPKHSVVKSSLLHTKFKDKIWINLNKLTSYEEHSQCLVMVTRNWICIDSNTLTMHTWSLNQTLSTPKESQKWNRRQESSTHDFPYKAVGHTMCHQHSLFFIQLEYNGNKVHSGMNPIFAIKQYNHLSLPHGDILKNFCDLT